MKQAELKVIRFDENDIIATSGAPKCTSTVTLFQITSCLEDEEGGTYDTWWNIYTYNKASGKWELYSDENENVMTSRLSGWYHGDIYGDYEKCENPNSHEINQ